MREALPSGLWETNAPRRIGLKDRGSGVGSLREEAVGECPNTRRNLGKDNLPVAPEFRVSDDHRFLVMAGD
jgi:hypothetical protein